MSTAWLYPKNILHAKRTKWLLMVTKPRGKFYSHQYPTTSPNTELQIKKARNEANLLLAYPPSTKNLQHHSFT
jgi:hypothetical protein